MQGPAKVLGHSIHPMLVGLPIGLFLSSVVCDVLHMTLHNHVFGPVAFWMMTFGIIGAVFAAIPGLIDWLSIPSGTRAFRVGLIHMFVNIASLGFFIFSWWARMWGHLPDASWAPFTLALIGLVLLVVGGWLGGELVEQHGLSVRHEAGLNAPTSVSVDHPRIRKSLRRPNEPSPI